MKSKRHNFEITFYSGVVKRRPNYIEALIPLAEAYTRNGFYEQGLEIDKRLSELCGTDPVVHYNLACSYALVGDKTLALAALKKSVKLGYSDFEHMRKDADLRCLHGLPEFEALAGISKSSRNH